MYTISKRIEIAGSHRLNLDYDSPCSELHGHNWNVIVEVQGERLNENGMLIDFKHIKEIVNQLDHSHINDHISLNPTAENMAFWIAFEIQKRINEEWEGDEIPCISKVSVQESEGNLACYIP